MRRILFVMMAAALCSLVLTTSCNKNEKKIAEQQAVIDSLMKEREAYLKKEAEEKEKIVPEQETEDLDTAELVALSEVTPREEVAPQEEEPTEGAPIREEDVDRGITVYCCSSDGFVNIREKPTTQSAILGKLTAGGRGAQVLDSSGKWWKVEDNAIKGYVHSSQITTDLSKSQAVAAKLAKAGKSPTTYYVVAGSYSSVDEAKKAAGSSDLFAGSRVYKTVKDGKTVYRLCPFEFSSKSDADRWARDIKNSFKIDAWVWGTTENPPMVFKMP